MGTKELNELKEQSAKYAKLLFNKLEEGLTQLEDKTWAESMRYEGEPNPDLMGAKEARTMSWIMGKMIDPDALREIATNMLELEEDGIIQGDRVTVYKSTDRHLINLILEDEAIVAGSFIQEHDMDMESMIDLIMKETDEISGKGPMEKLMRPLVEAASKALILSYENRYFEGIDKAKLMLDIAEAAAQGIIPVSYQTLRTVSLVLSKKVHKEAVA